MVLKVPELLGKIDFHIPLEDSRAALVWEASIFRWLGFSTSRWNHGVAGRGLALQKLRFSSGLISSRS